MGIAKIYMTAFKAPPEANNGIMTELVCAVQRAAGALSILPVIYAAQLKIIAVQCVSV